jgi:putative phosphoribosyl transferase
MFRNRQHAGELLAALLSGYRSQPKTLVLALPRGGVPVAAVLARGLGLPLDVFPVRKLGAPGQPEFAMGAIAVNGLVVLHQHAIANLHVPQSTLDAVIAREHEELLRQERTYRESRPPLILAGKTAILVDDGLATGYTMLAAIRAVREQHPARIVVAVPVAPSETLDLLRPEADEAVCAHMPRELFAIGQFYEDFTQITDDQVREALRELANGPAAPQSAGAAGSPDHQ